MLRCGTFLFTLMFLVACTPTQTPTELNWRAPNMYEEKQAQLSYASEIQMADRSYVESVLLQVFNAAGTPAAAYIQSDVYQKVEFGGSCDFYAPSDKGAGVIEFPREQCFTGIGVVQGSNNNPMRYSLTTKVCERLVIDSARMSDVRAKLWDDGQWHTPDDASIQKAWSLFFPIEKAHPEIVKAFKDIGAASGGDEEAWKNIILTMCISPEWQVL